MGVKLEGQHAGKLVVRVSELKNISIRTEQRKVTMQGQKYFVLYPLVLRQFLKNRSCEPVFLDLREDSFERRTHSSNNSFEKEPVLRRVLGVRTVAALI